MKEKIILGMIFAITISLPLVPSAFAAPFVCAGVIQLTLIDSNFVVPEDEFCGFSGEINGNVHVNHGSLFHCNFCTINGDLKSENNHSNVLSNMILNGNFHSLNANELAIRDSKINGNLSIMKTDRMILEDVEFQNMKLFGNNDVLLKGVLTGFGDATCMKNKSITGTFSLILGKNKGCPIAT